MANQVHPLDLIKHRQKPDLLLDAISGDSTVRNIGYTCC